MKTKSKRRPQTEIFKAWLYYNAQYDWISFAEFRKEVWPEWISIFRHPVIRSKYS